MLTNVHGLIDKIPFNPAGEMDLPKKETRLLLNFNFDFEHDVNEQGIVVLLASDLTNNLVLDFSPSEASIRVDVLHPARRIALATGSSGILQAFKGVKAPFVVQTGQLLTSRTRLQAMW